MELEKGNKTYYMRYMLHIRYIKRYSSQHDNILFLEHTIELTKRMHTFMLI